MKPNQLDMTTDSGTKIPWFNKVPSSYLKQSILLYGASGSGKSVCIKEIMYICRKEFPLCFVITETNFSNNTFTGIVPESCIFDKIDVEWIAKVVKSQREKVTAFKQCYTIEILRPIFMKIVDFTKKEKERELLDKTSSMIQTINDNKKIEPIEKKIKIKHIKDRAEETLLEFYTHTIKKCFSEKNEKFDVLTDIEKIQAKAAIINTNLLIIFDDCASKLKESYKQNQELFKELFYQGRHYHMTFIIGVQDDKELSPEMRKNAFISIFTDKVSANSVFQRTSNGFSNTERKKANEIINTIFHSSTRIKNFKKMIYIRRASDYPFQYTICDEYENFHMGNSMIWKLDKKKKNKKENTEIDFLKKLKDC